MNPPVRPRRVGVGELLKAGSFFSAWVAGFLGAMVVRYLGEPLAMGGQMWVAMNTEPVRPHLAFPVVATALVALLPIPFALGRRWNLALIAALPFFALPWWHFSRLYTLAKGEPP